TDQLSGRMMGVRADMTPQVARIDAHRLKRDVPTRLCYMGTVLNTRPDGFAGSRSPMQIGAELYGHSGLDSDLEVSSMMIETLKLAGITQFHIDVGHVDIFGKLTEQAGLSEDQESAYFDMLQRKAVPEITAFVDSLAIDARYQDGLRGLASLNGDMSAIDRARSLLGSIDGMTETLDEVVSFCEQLSASYPGLDLNIDLAELRGYNYHTGIVFAAYVPGQGKEIALGGRYDDIGKVFGHARPATGFSTDLKTLLSLSSEQAESTTDMIFAPADHDASLRAVIASLRSEGQRVIIALEGQTASAEAMGCTHQLVSQNGEWVMQSI
ncbi:MAG: ATP phosphoribosyltransferase regulatory subunit, partial [Gammaproteobacteria bacterium]|nr:ATP phosphoribosyltransferase regulatory subunit [Gammaproteobacteria bacterium]